MAGVRDRELVQLGPWPQGINNLAKEGSLPADPETGLPLALRELDNMDLDAGGFARARQGYGLVHAGNLMHSLWSHPEVPFALVVDGGQLHAVHAGREPEPLGAMVGSQPVSYELINDRIAFTNRTACGLVLLDQRVCAWAPEHPGGLPDIAPVAGFGLSAGQYQVAVTFMDELGRESGCGAAAAVDCADGQGIQLNNIPQPLRADTAAVLVYATGANDQVLRLAARLLPGTQSHVLTVPAEGRSLTTQFLQPLPAGQLTRLFNGRQYVAAGGQILWSDPLRYGMFNPVRNRVGFRGQVDVMEPGGQEGMFVAAGQRTYFLGGQDPANWGLRMVRSSGAAPGSIRVPGNVLGFDSTEDWPVWIERTGHFCVGSAGGQVLVLKEGEAVINDADRAALMFRQQDGLQQLVASLRGARPQGLAVRDRAVARVVYDGSKAP